MSGWGDDLMQSGHLVEATAILILNLQNHPDSSDPFNVMGEIKAKQGEGQLARASFDKALRTSKRTVSGLLGKAPAVKQKSTIERVQRTRISIVKGKCSSVDHAGVGYIPCSLTVAAESSQLRQILQIGSTVFRDGFSDEALPATSISLFKKLEVMVGQRMYALRVALTLDKIEALAPDQPSLAAARKLLKASAWPTLAVGNDLVWGECQGSGSTPYRVVISEVDAGYKCTCPSRKFPCKHSLALMWIRAEGTLAFSPTPVPEWVKDWLGRRRGPSAPAEKEEIGEGPKPSIRLAENATEETGDPKSEARAAAVRERNRIEREAAVLSGLEDLDVWLNDQVERGMAAFVMQSAKECRAISQRLVDAKAPALATRLDAIPSRLFSLPEPARPTAAIKELGQVHLIAQAHRRQNDLPGSLLPDIRQALGWTVTRDALLADETALRVQGTWRTLAVLSEVQPDRLRRIETWVWCEDEGAAVCTALLLDFVPVASGSAATGGYGVGDRFNAELVFYPSALPQRAQILQRSGETHVFTGDVSFPVASLMESFTAYGDALSKLPWLGTWPITFSTAEVRRAGGALYVVEVDSGLALPIAELQATTALPLARVGTMNGFGLWNGYAFTLCWAQTALGRWVNA